MMKQENTEPKDQEYVDQQRQLRLSETDWWKRVCANANRMAVDEEYRKLIAKDLS